MNWNEIDNKYPKAYKEFGNWIDKDGYDTDRDLYDFFDEQGIYIHIYNTRILAWYWEIEEYRNGRLYNEDIECPISYKSRKEAEEQAFLKAFFILEEKLCEGK